MYNAAVYRRFAYIGQGHVSLANYIVVPHHDKMPFRDLFTAASTEAINLLAKFLAYDPKRRISARDVRLSNKYVSQATDSPSFKGTSSRIFLLNA